MALLWLLFLSLPETVVAQRPPVVNFAEFKDYLVHPDKETELFVREYGNRKGEVVIVLHGGWGAEHSYLIAPLAPLAKKYHLVFYDQRGSLRSHTSLESISVEKHVEDLEYLRKSLGVERMILVAHSMGGFLAASYVAKYPERVGGLVLISPVPPKFDANFWEAGQTEILKLRASDDEIVGLLKQRGLTKEQNPHGFTEKQDLLRRQLFFSTAGGNIYHWRANWETVSLGFYSAEAGSKASSTMPKSPDLIEAMRRVPCPIIVICGDKDYIPLRYQEAWVNSVPKARLIVIKDAAHLIWIDNPVIFEKTLVEAMNRLHTQKNQP